MENITKNNVLIAAFMGFDKTDIGWYDNEDRLRHPSGDNTFIKLKFHTSWDWLMPVVEHIVTHPEIGQMLEGKEWDHHYSQIHDAVWSLNIEETYYEVVSFIKWYNSQKTMSRETRVKLVQALHGLWSSFDKLNDLWSGDNTDEMEQILSEGYPFNTCFNELTSDVASWTGGATDRIKGLDS